MIKTLSPYYVTTPFTLLGGVICNKYTLEILVWEGNKLIDVPSIITYSITINNPTASEGDSKVNISRLINDYIEFTPVTLTSTALENSNNQIWVRTQVKYYINDVLEPQVYHQDTQIAVQGYGYGLSGENPDTPDNKVLMRVGDYTMKDSDGFFIVPIELDEISAPIPEIVIVTITQDGVTLDADIAFTSVGDYTEFAIVGELGGVFAPFPAVGITSPQTITFPAYGTWDITMFGYDQATNTTATSNVKTVTITP